MKQRAKILIEFNDGYNVYMLRQRLEEQGCKVEVHAVLLPLKGFTVPNSFCFKDEVKE